MKKKLFLVIAIVLFLVLSSTGFFLFHGQPSQAQNIVEPSSDSAASGQSSVPANEADEVFSEPVIPEEPVPTQDPSVVYGPDLSQEELDDLGESDAQAEAPGMAIGDEFVIELDDNQATGSL